MPVPHTPSEQEAARRLEMLLLSREKDSVLLGLQLALNPGLDAGQTTLLLALSLFAPDQDIRDRAFGSLKQVTGRELIDHVTQHWQDTHRKGRARVFYTAVRAISKFEGLDAKRLMKFAVQMTMKFPEGVAHQFPGVFAEWCRLWSANDDHLYLGGHQIPHLPSSIAQFGHLKHLSLENCQLKQLHPALAKLDQLAFLDLSGNDLEDLPDYLDRMPALVDLRWDKNPIRRFPQVLVRMPAIQKMDINLEVMRNLDGLEQCEHLGWLQLKKGRQAEFPPQVSALRQLRSLEMSEAGLQSVPQALQDFDQLEELDLSGNHFLIFPQPILHLNRLKSLAMGWIAHPDIPKAFDNFPRLQRLTLQCRFPEWPSGWCDLPQLLVLHLEDGLLERLPDAFVQLEQLDSLNLEKNRFREFPEVLTRMPQLMKLELHNNKLESLPESIAEMSSLSVLDLSHNPLTSLPEAIFKLPRLSRLELGNTKLPRDLQQRLRKELPRTQIRFN